MGSNWAKEFRQRIEESEGKYKPPENFDDTDEEEWEEKEEEQDAEIEEPEDEAEEETEESEQEHESQEEAEEVGQETGKSEMEKPLPNLVQTPKLSLERQRFRQELDKIIGNTIIQPAKTEVTKAEPVIPAKRKTNDLAVAGAAMIGLMALSLMPTFYQAMMQAFQPLIQSFQNLSGRSYGTSATGHE